MAKCWPIGGSGGFEATRLVEGELRSQRFNDRDAAAAWLAKLAGG